jgi:membrane associated rhomboid family serine protease
MAFQDRDYYRGTSETGYVTSMVVKLIIVNGIVFLIEAVLLAHYQDASGRNGVASLLGVHSNTIVRPDLWWQFLTAGFVHAPERLTHILFNRLGLYCFGTPLEERYGRREFLWFYLSATVLGFIVWSASHHFLTPLDPRIPCFGASGGVTAATILFCLLYPRATILASFLFPVPAWLMGIIIILSNLFGSSETVAYDVHMVGATFALGYWYFGWNFRRLPGLDRVSKVFAKRQKWFKPRPPLKVHDPEQYYDNLDAEADRLLEKVAQHGLSSLTNQEKRTLEDYSRRTRQKLR